MPLWKTASQREIAGLDAVADCQRIVYLLACFEFPWDMTRSLELALFRTFCAPAVSQVLAATGEFVERTQKRYDDTDILISELIEHGYDDERGQAAISRINQIHGRFAIENHDFLYVLSTFIYEPIRWLDRFGWRKPSDQERLALFAFWSEVGRRMAIRDIPATSEQLERYNRDYEAENFEYRDTNRSIGQATTEMMAGWFPGFLKPLVRSSIRSLLDETMCRCFGLARPNAVWRATVTLPLWLRRIALRLGPARRRPRLRAATGRRSYPDGYEIRRLGPETPGRNSG